MWDAQFAPKAVDAPLLPSELIVDVSQRSSRAHIFQFYTFLCEIAFLFTAGAEDRTTSDILKYTSYKF